MNSVILYFQGYSHFLTGLGSSWKEREKRWEYQTSLSVSRETCMQVKKQQLEPDMEKQTGSKLGKEYVKAIYCQPAYLTYMKNIACKILG